MTAVGAPAGPRPQVLIAGCGDLGTEAGLHFARRGWAPIGLRRDPGRLPAAIQPVAGDLTGSLTAACASLPPTIDALVFAPSAGQRTPSAYRAVYLQGLERLLTSLDQADRRPGKVLAVSSTALYGIDDGSDVDEDSPSEPATETGQILLEAEMALHAHRPDGVSLRLAGIYGPGRTRLIDQVRSGRARIPLTPMPTNRIHRDDAAAAIVHLVDEVADPDRVYLGVDDAPVDLGEVLRFLARSMDLPEPPAGAGTSSRGGNKRCRNRRLSSTGFSLTYPTYREGYAAVLAGHGVRHD